MMDEIQCESVVVPEESMRVPSRIRDPTGRDRARQVLLGMTTALAVVAVCMVLAGVSERIFRWAWLILDLQVTVNCIPSYSSINFLILPKLVLVVLS
jgi:hypothetical protein